MHLPVSLALAAEFECSKKGIKVNNQKNYIDITSSILFKFGGKENFRRYSSLSKTHRKFSNLPSFPILTHVALYLHTDQQDYDETGE
jgi:hypothetical protein